MLTDRRGEREVLDRLAGAVRGGQGRVLVVRGDPGVGKTVLLDYLAGRARGCRVARVAGVQSEMELVFAGLHQLCAPLLGRAEHLPVPQREALRTALGLAAGPPPDRFMVGLAVLSLLSEVAGERPLVCLVDDEQWLDQASAQALGFVARRLGADPVGLVFAAREPGAELAGLPELAVGGLCESDARALLDSALAGPLDDRVRDQIVAETRGNPLALLELPRGLSPADLAGGFGLPGAAPLSERIAGSFRRQLEALPGPSRRLVLLAAAEHVSILAVPELVEAAARTGNADVAAGALRRLAETTQPGGNDLALGIEARCRALLSDGETAERLYQEAIGRLGRTELRPDLARAHLQYGEWLRRQARRGDAREQLRTAYDMLEAIGMEAFAERASRELIATGETVRKRTVETSVQLTAQETLIAQLARDGHSNAEIATQLFLSARTVEWHLRQIFTKLGIGSRRELRQALPAGSDSPGRGRRRTPGVATRPPRDGDCR